VSEPVPPIFEILDAHVSVAGRPIVKGVSLRVRPGEKHALMGPNGSGKSTLANALMGHPTYSLDAGRIFLRGEEITALPADERSRRGLFLAFQYPVAVPGVTVAGFLRAALQARRPGDETLLRDFRKTLKAKMDALGIDAVFAGRYLNDGFSGGEKKRLEILQMAMLEPAMAVLDETDSGLDIDALQTVAAGVNAVCGERVGVLLITHYQRLLNYIRPTHVHVFIGGRIVRSGGPELALELEAKGYEPIERELGLEKKTA
jgi:Fe-S cluster assembly ATP-binding protein